MECSDLISTSVPFGPVQAKTTEISCKLQSYIKPSSNRVSLQQKATGKGAAEEIVVKKVVGHESVYQHSPKFT